MSPFQYFSTEEYPCLLQNKRHMDMWRRCTHLIIDEISMVDGHFFAKVEYFARRVRSNDQPFGGIQLILAGDFLQLPPVSRNGAERQFCFETEAWQKCVHVTMELSIIRRQTDPTFIRMLNEFRIGRCRREAEELMLGTKNNDFSADGLFATRLCTHSEDAVRVNEMQLKILPGSPTSFLAKDSQNGMASFLDVHTPAVSALKLKKGAQVMLTKNLDVSLGLVNGARGFVKDFKKVKLLDTATVAVTCEVEKILRPRSFLLFTGNG